MKRYLGSYLRRVYPQLLIFILFSMVFYITFKVSNLGMEYYYMAIEIMIFFMLAYLIFILAGHKKSLSMADQVDNLTFEKKQLINKMTNEKNDMRDYYTIWIHQMKTPITVANLLVDEMDEDNTRLKNDLKKELMYIEDYTNMAMTYLKIVNRQADMDLTSVYLDDIIRSVLKKYSMVFISNHISIDYKPMDISVVSDYSWLSILVEQLVSNAAKYTSNGSVKFVFHRE
ncbi:MAG: sensor histidine kinase, partial [Peptostreptococcus sp.]|nr:sensor histidine kinase [Peptostreptococcus sp.]